MRKTRAIILTALMLFSLLPFKCLAEESSLAERSKNQMLELAETKYPGWRVADITVWQPLQHVNVQVILYRVRDGMLRIKMLTALFRSEEDFTPEPREKDCAPVPVSEEAARRFVDWKPKQMYDGTVWLDSERMPGCAEFMLRAGEAWEELVTSGNCLIGLARDAAGRKGLRIARWNGTEYDPAVVATAMWEKNRQLNPVSMVGSLRLDDEDVTPGRAIFAECDREGVWRLYGVHNGYGLFIFFEDHLLDAARGQGGAGNDYWHYGKLPFSLELAGADLDSVPCQARALIGLLDAGGWACVRESGTPLYQAPDGEIIASAYARLAGKVAGEEGDWVCLQVGSEARGMRVWCRRENLAFGSDTENVRCGFPGYEIGFEEPFSDILNRYMTGLEQPFPREYEAEGYPASLWLVALLPDGRYLAEVNGDIVGEISSEAFLKILPAEPYRPNGELEDVIRLTVEEWEALLEAAGEAESPDQTMPQSTSGVSAEENAECPPDTELYYNPDGGMYYHADPNCPSVSPVWLPLRGTVTYAQLNEPAYRTLHPCKKCRPPERKR